MRVTVDGFVASPAFGGFIRYIESLTAALTAFGGVEVHHVAPAGQPFPDTSRFPDRVHVHEVPLSSPEGGRPGDAWTDEILPGVLDEISPDVHLGPAFILPPTHGRPQVVTLHDTMFERYPQFYSAATRAYLRGQTLRALDVADAAIAVSEATRTDALADWTPRIPIHVTPLAPQRRAHRGSPRPLPAPYLLNVGGAHPRKRLDVLIEAFELVVRHPAAPRELELVLIGVADDARVLELVAASPVAPRIRLTGRVGEDELAAWYAHAELFVYPSEYEGFGLGPLEAMDHGLPVITYRNSALVEVLGEAAVHAEDGSWALANRTIGLLRDPQERARRSQAGRDRASLYSWERTARTTMQALEDAISRHRATGAEG